MYSIREVLWQWEQFADYLAQLAKSKILRARDPHSTEADKYVYRTENPHPIEDLYRGALNHWTFAGGFIKFSRTAEDNKPVGQLITYMRAVTGPIMGADAPAAEGIVKIVLRYAKELQHYVRLNPHLAEELRILQRGDSPTVSRGPLGSGRRRPRFQRADEFEARLLVRGPARGRDAISCIRHSV
jgi:hypothetical protein